jgi:hypothetical protein
VLLEGLCGGKANCQNQPPSEQLRTCLGLIFSLCWCCCIAHDLFIIMTNTSPIGMPLSQPCSYESCGPPKPCPLVNNGDRREVMDISADFWTDSGSGEDWNKLFKYRVAINCLE